MSRLNAGYRAVRGRAGRVKRRYQRWRKRRAMVARQIRLVQSPVFVLSSIRSGSTLLRVILNSHSRICAPHEMHLARLKVEFPHPNVEAGMAALDFTPRDLENLLWDRVLHFQMKKAGKSIIVDKTPQNVLDWKRLRRMWPEARYIFLLRHPVAVVDSMVRAWPKIPMERQYANAERYAIAIAEAQRELPGLTVRYEDLTARPEELTHEICAWLGVRWEQGMIRYGEHDHGKFAGRLGDWKATIKTGVIRPAEPLPAPEEIPDELRKACELLGYL